MWLKPQFFRKKFDKKEEHRSWSGIGKVSNQ